MTATSADGRRVGVVGGTFDPPHIGHLIVASEARWQLGLDEVRLVPAREPPHKPDRLPAPPEARLRWLERAIDGREGRVGSRAEIDRPGPSYTADTLERMAAGEPGAHLWFVLGSDQLEGFAGWHDPGRILRLARLAVVPRAGADPEAVRALADRVAPGRADWLDVPAVAVSSTMIRARIAAGLPIAFLVPRGVEEALAEEGLVASPRIGPTERRPRDIA